MKDLKIKKIRPQFTTVLTTLDCYEEDLVFNGTVAAPKGTMKLYQRVLAVGPCVRDIKEGDLVLLNLSAYIKPMYQESSVKNNITTMEETIEYRFPKMILDGKLVGKFQDRDIEGVIEDYEEVETDTAKAPLL